MLKTWLCCPLLAVQGQGSRPHLTGSDLSLPNPVNIPRLLPKHSLVLSYLSPDVSSGDAPLPAGDALPWHQFCQWYTHANIHTHAHTHALTHELWWGAWHGVTNAHSGSLVEETHQSHSYWVFLSKKGAHEGITLTEAGLWAEPKAGRSTDTAASTWKLTQPIWFWPE